MAYDSIGAIFGFVVHFPVVKMQHNLVSIFSPVVKMWHNLVSIFFPRGENVTRSSIYFFFS